MHAAQHDSVNGAEPRYATYASTLHDPSADAEAAAATAAHEVLVAFFPEGRAALDERLAESLSRVSDGDAEDAGVALGRAVGDAILEARRNDGYDTPDPFSPAPAPGIWEPTPPAFAPMLESQFQNVAPFTLRDRGQFLPGPPPWLTSRRCARDYDEVKLVGQDISPARTPDQTQLAAGDRHPPGDTDGNPATTPDPSWMSLRPTPPLPDYPSTHSLLGGAAAEILRRFTGTSRFPFCMVSATSTPSGTQRCWDSFTQAELENAESRVLVGFHFRSAIETGVEVGREVGRFAMRHSLLPLTVMTGWARRLRAGGSSRSSPGGRCGRRGA
jgi:hypothetical protein